MDKKISDLDLVSALDLNDVLPIVNAGSTKKVKVSQLVKTNLTYSPAISSGQVVSDNGTAATVPLADSTNAGLFSATEKTKLSGIATGAEVNVNADWNAISGDALILNKPTILAPENFIPYVGATANLDMGEYGATVSQLSLDTTPIQEAIVTTTQWNDSIGTSQTTLKGGNVILKNGMDLLARIVNKVTPNTTLTKANYQAVRVSGATGQRLSVELAQANLDNNSVDTIGLVCENISTNQEGFIITMGQLLDINTTGSLQGETWADGDVLYLSPTTAGAITNVKPNGLNGHIIVIGYVEYKHINNGKIFVKIMNGWELDELHNVYINAEANEDFLQYESATQLWKNKALTATLIRSKLGITTLSGDNTGDNATNTQYSGLAASKADKASPIFTGTVVLPSTTSIGNVTNTEIGYLDNVTSPIQTQIDSKLGNLTITTTGNGAATLVTNTLNIPTATESWIDYSATSTIVGWSSFTLKVIQYKKIGTDCIILNFGLSGTSNATTATFTAPFTPTSASDGTVCKNTDSVLGNLLGFVRQVTSSATITIFSNATATAFTTTGTKTVQGTIIIKY